MTRLCVSPIITAADNAVDFVFGLELDCDILEESTSYSRLSPSTKSDDKDAG